MIITANASAVVASAAPSGVATGPSQAASATTTGRQAPQDVVSLSRAARQVVQAGDRDNDGDSH